MTETAQNTPTSVPTQIKMGGLPSVFLATPGALSKIKEFAAKMTESQGKHFRVYVEAGGCSGFQYGYTFDDIRDGDEIVKVEDVQILLDPNSKPYLMGSTLDYIEDFKGAGFTVRNPQAKASCGCGTSFSV